MEDSGKQESESPKHAPKITIILERHGQSINPRVKPETPEEIARLGKLSDEGIQTTVAAARAKAEEILQDPSPVSFFFLGSPSQHFIDGEAFGARGQDTMSTSAAEVQKVINEKGLPVEKAQIVTFGKNVDGSRPHKALSEPDYFYVDGSEDPRGYFVALQEKYGKEGREEGWLDIPTELEELRQAVGAQSAGEVSGRVMRLAKVIEKYSTWYHEKYPDRRMVFFLGTHGDVMRAVLQHGFSAGEVAKGHTYQYNDMLEMQAENYKASISFDGHTYETDL